MTISLGKKLKEAREKKSLTIEQVQKQTHIHSTVLTALEEGRADEVLTATYVKSFLKKYAQYLGLDTSEVLKAYEQIHYKPTPANTVPSTPHIKPAEEQPPPPQPQEEHPILRFVYFAGLVVLLAAFSFCLIFFGTKFARSLSQKKKAVKTVSQVQTAKKKKARSAKKPAAQPPSAKTKAASQQLIISKTTPLNLTLKVEQPVLIKLKKDGVLLFKRVLEKGLVESIVANDKIELDIAKAEAIQLVLNGKPVTLPKKGVIVGLEITRKGIQIK